MRTARIKADGAGYYHCMSRVIEGRYIFQEQEKEKFRRLMRQLEAFSGVQILTYTILSNHFHILLHVPKRPVLSDEQLMERLAALYEPYQVKQIAAMLADLRKHGTDEQVEKFRNKYIYRMFDVSQFMKPLKQRFSQYYNKKVGRRGPLWEQRFKSILVEGSQGALSAMAAYIDLNCIRAGMVSDPKDYRYCGYGEAMGGSEHARTGLARITDGLGLGCSWNEASRAYREYLYMQGQQKGLRPDGKPLRVGFKEEEVEAVLKQGGRLPMQEILRCRVRYFSDGLVLGSKDFVDATFARYRDQFGLKRTSGARAMRYGDWNGLCTMRDLRQAVIVVPPAT